MKKFIKVHFVYFLSKKNIISILLCLLITVITMTSVILSNMKLALNFTEQLDYSWETIYSFNKIITVILTCFLMNNFIVSVNDNYKVLFLINTKKHMTYYLSKVFTVLISIISFVFLSFLLYLIINLICNKYFVLTLEYVRGYLMILFISIVFGLISLVISRIMDNTICVIIPILVYICCEFFEISGKIINTFFPNYVVDVVNNEFLLCFSHCIILSIFYVILFLWILKE